MTRALLAAALGTVASAIAITTPARVHAEEGDSRLVEHPYDPGEVVRIEGKVNVQATIKFGEDESIENVAIGDSMSWQVTPNKRANLLFVKPLTPTAMTNMTVITDRRAYFFDLVANPNAQPLYLLDFAHPEDVERSATIPPATQAAAEDLRTTAAKDPYAIVNPAALNFAWRTEGDEKLLPERIYDDGNATFLLWPGGQQLPAILVKDHQGIEGPVNFAVRGDVIVIDGVPREIVLRSGRDAANLFNQGPIRADSDRAGSALARANAQEVNQ